MMMIIIIIIIIIIMMIIKELITLIRIDEVKSCLIYLTPRSNL